MSLYLSLELAIKAQDNISNFANKVNMSRAGLYNIIKGRKEPKLQTIFKRLKERGYTLKIA